jgi:hypothetical protein
VWQGACSVGNDRAPERIPRGSSDYGRRLLVRRDSDRECHQPPNGNATRSRRVRVLVEVRPNLPLALIPRLDKFSDSGHAFEPFPESPVHEWSIYQATAATMVATRWITKAIKRPYRQPRMGRGSKSRLVFIGYS